MEIVDQDKIALLKKVRKFRMKATMYALEISILCLNTVGVRSLEMNVTSESGIRSYLDS